MSRVHAFDSHQRSDAGEVRARTWEDVEEALAEVDRKEAGLRRSLAGLMIEDSPHLENVLTLLKSLARSEDVKTVGMDIFPLLVEDGWALTAAVEKGEVEAAFVAAQRRAWQLSTAQEMVDAFRRLPWVLSEVDVEEWLVQKLDGWGASELHGSCLALLVGAYVFSRRFGPSEGKETRAALLAYVTERRANP